MIASDALKDLQKRVASAREAVDSIAAGVDALEKADAEVWDWLGIREAAELTGVSQGTLYTKINKGELEARTDLGRIMVRKSQLIGGEDGRAGEGA